MSENLSIKNKSRNWEEGIRTLEGMIPQLCTVRFPQVKYYNAEGYELERYREAILKFQVRGLVGAVLCHYQAWGG